MGNFFSTHGHTHTHPTIPLSPLYCYIGKDFDFFSNTEKFNSTITEEEAFGVKRQSEEQQQHGKAHFFFLFIIVLYIYIYMCFRNWKGKSLGCSIYTSIFGFIKVK